MSEKDWIELTSNCPMPKDGERVLVAYLGAEFDHITIAKYDEEDCSFRSDEDGSRMSAPRYWMSLRPLYKILSTRV